MRVTYLKLENVAGLYVGSNRTEIEISFENSKNRIINIEGHNTSGKSCLMSSISPFAYPASLDERSTLSYIIPKRNGYKEIHYANGKDTYVIKHYYKAAGKSHTVKSYFTMNDRELNENGNVRSFNALVEMHFGLTEDMMRLVRLGSNVSSFVALAPAKRKEYIGKLISEIDVFLKIYKSINEEIRVVKAMMAANATRLYNCHIVDVTIEEDNLKELASLIKKLERDRDSLISRISKLQALMADNDIDDLRRKLQESKISLEEFDRVKQKIQEQQLMDTTLEQLVAKRNQLSEERIDTQSKINSYRISIDNAHRNIERLEVAIKRITSDHDMQSLIDAIRNTKEAMEQTPNVIRTINPRCTSEELYQMITRLSSFNILSKTIHGFGSKPMDVYLKLRRDNKSVDQFLREQKKKSLSRLNQLDLQSIMDKVFQDEDIITPSCSEEFISCPYYRLADTIESIKDSLEQDSYDDETLRYIEVIANNVDDVLNELDRSQNIKIPEKLRDDLCEKELLERLKNRLPFFDLSGLEEYLSIVKEHELFMYHAEHLKQYEYQLSVYKNSGVDTQMAEVRSLQESIEFYRKNIDSLQDRLSSINDKMAIVDNQIGLVTKYQDGKKYRKIFESTIESTKKILEPLESAASEKMELDYELRQIKDRIQHARDNHRELDTKLTEYYRLTSEADSLKKKHRDLSIIQESTSTKEGVPVIYMKQYLGQIESLANALLEVIYGDEVRLGRMKVGEDTFEIPYIKNGTKVPDVKYGSQSEVPLMNMALSFALANKASANYNIILLDEIDSGLDEANRYAFLKMLEIQMNTLHAEQVFIISHNMSQMINIPMDCISLSDVGSRNKLQNVIFE